MPESGPSTPSGRFGYIDQLRGLAVLLMIQAHVFDAWTRPVARASAGFRYATILGGFAAPFFLWLAGVGIALSADGVLRRTGNCASAVDLACRRGLQIFILAFLFRLQAFVLSPGSHPITLFRVDILNVMGLAMVAAGVTWGLAQSASAKATFCGLVAAAIAMLTPVVRTADLVDHLPVWVAWYIRPAGEYTTLTTFPWAGFVFAGTACGVLVAAARTVQRRLLIILGFTGLGLFGLGMYTASLPTIYRQSSFWTSSPTYFAVRAGVLLMAFPGMYVLSLLPAFRTLVRPLERFGRGSLFIYWIHVELVYGYASWALHRRLPLWGTLVAFLAFSALMYGAVVLRDRFVGLRRARTWRPPELPGRTLKLKNG